MASKEVLSGEITDKTVLKKIIDYHGPLLLRKFQATRPRNWLATLKMTQGEFTFNEYKKRSKRLTGVKKALDMAFEVMLFTHTKSSDILQLDSTHMNTDDLGYEEPGLPLELLIPTEAQISRTSFYENVKMFDILIGLVNGKMVGLEQTLDVICYAHGKAKIMKDLGIQALLKLKKHEKSWPKCTYLKVVVTSYEKNTRILKVSVDVEDLPHVFHDKITLGYLEWMKCPCYKYESEYNTIETYHHYLAQKKSHKSETTFRNLLKKHNLNLKRHCSFVDNLKNLNVQFEDDIKTEDNGISKTEVVEFTNNETEMTSVIVHNDSTPNSKESNGNEIIKGFLETELQLKGIHSPPSDNQSKDDLSPLSQKMAMQEGQWQPPSYIDQNASYFDGTYYNTSVPPPGYSGQSSQPYYDSQQYSYSYTQTAYNGSVDEQEQEHTAKVEEFLQKLNRRNTDDDKNRSESYNYYGKTKAYSSKPRDYRRHSTDRRERNHHYSSSRRSRSRSRERSNRSGSKRPRSRSRSHSKVSAEKLQHSSRKESQSKHERAEKAERLNDTLNESSSSSNDDNEEQNNSRKRNWLPQHKKSSKGYTGKDRRIKNSDIDDLHIPGLDNIEEKLKNYYKKCESKIQTLNR